MTKERKYILIVGVVALILGTVYRFYPDIQGFQSFGSEIALKQRKVIKYRRMAQERNALNTRLIALNRTLERAEASLLTGATPALAAVDIQNILNDITSRSDVEIKSMRVLDPKKSEEKDSVKAMYLSIPVQISMNPTIRQLKEVLYRIENYPKFLRISDLRIRLNNVRQVEYVYSTLTVEGFMKTEEDLKD